MTAGSHVRVAVLGPLQLEVDGVPVAVPGPKRRAVLALLAMAGGRTVSADALCDALWSDDEAGGAQRSLHSHVSRLRAHLGAAAHCLRREGAGYRLECALDLAEVRARAATLRGGAGDPAPRAEELRALLGRWRGPALAEFGGIEPLDAEAVAIEDLRRDLEDDLLEARLALGDPSVTGDAAAAAARDPFRERSHRVLVRALAAAGRQVDAMRAAQVFRARLVEGTGLSPGAEFEALEHEVAAGAFSQVPSGLPLPTLARPSGPFVGRDGDVARVQELLQGARVVTLVGPGGVGKTRLAREVAHRHASGNGAEPGDGRAAAMVELGRTRRPAEVGDAVARALGVRPGTDEDALTATVDRLADHALLLVVDNCEHVLDGARDVVGRIVAACPRIHVLATSRAPLGDPGEHVLRLDPLAVPGGRGATGITWASETVGSGEVLGAVPAVAAFLAHARRQGAEIDLTDPPEAQAIAEVVRQLDGLPLALELAAARVASLGVVGLRDRLHRALDLGAPSAAPERHETLRAAVAWSYRLLGPDEARLLRAMALFPAGLDLEAVEALTLELGPTDDPAGPISRLVNASMAVVDHGPPRRFRLLETVRAFAADELARTGEQEEAGRHLRAWARREAAAVDETSRGPDEAAADIRLRHQFANLAAAHDLADRVDDVDTLADLVLALDALTMRRELQETWRWALDLASDDRLRGHRSEAAVLGAAARQSGLRGMLDVAEDLARAAVERAGDDRDRYRAYDALAVVSLFRGALVDSERWWLAADEAAPPDARSPLFAASAALAAAYDDRLADAEADLEAAFARCQERHNPGDLAFCLYARAELRVSRDVEAAAADYLAAIELAQTSRAFFVTGISGVGLVSIWARNDDVAPAAEGFRWLVGHWRHAGHWTLQWTTLRNAAAFLARHGDESTALLMLLAADRSAEAAAMAPAHRRNLDRLVDELRRRLGDEGVRAVEDRLVRRSRYDVLDGAVTALEQVQDGAAAAPS